MKSKDKIDIYQFTDYREYLAAVIKDKRESFEHFSFRYFSQKAGYTSSGILKDVLAGRRGIPVKRIDDFMRPFGIKGKEQEYFKMMVLYNDEKDAMQKAQYYRLLIMAKRKPIERKLKIKEINYYKDWFNAAIRELVNLDDFQDDIKWISRKLKPGISEVRARKALELLLEMGLLKRDETGKLIQGTAKLTTDPDLTAQLIRDFNRNMIQLGFEAIERFEPKEREVSGATMSIPEDCVNEIREKIRKFKDEMMEYACNQKRDSHTIYQLNLQFFPLVENRKKKK